MEAALFAARIVSPLLIGYFTQSNDFSTILWIGLAICISSSLCCIFVLEEKLQLDDSPDHTKGLSFDPYVTFRDMLKLLGIPYQLGDVGVSSILRKYVFCFSVWTASLRSSVADIVACEQCIYT